MKAASMHANSMYFNFTAEFDYAVFLL